MPTMAPLRVRFARCARFVARRAERRCQASFADPPALEEQEVAATVALTLEVLGAFGYDSTSDYLPLADVPVRLLQIVPIPGEERVDSAGVRAKVQFVLTAEARSDETGTVTFTVEPGDWGMELGARCHGTAYLYTPGDPEAATNGHVARLTRRDRQAGGLAVQGC
jgi:hypothetical protein